MKRHEQNLREFLNQSFARFRNLPPEQVESACEHVLSRLRENAETAPEFVESKATPDRSFWRMPRFAFVALAGLVLLSVPFIRTFVSPVNVYAIVVTVSGSADRVADGEAHAVTAGEKIDSGKILRTNGGAGLVFDLTDGSRVEMHSNSELVIQAAEDGVLLQLNRGSIIVTSAKLRSGHLYVQTKDMTVSVVDAVFFVSVEEQGSRVAVIQGEADVRLGATSKKLLSGEQIATNPSMILQPLTEVIRWSQSAPALLALLQQSAPPAAAGPPKPAEVKEAFDVAAIRLRPGGGGGGGRNGGPGGSAYPPACGGGMDLDPSRVRVRGYTLYRLITMAYDGDCFLWERMSDPEPLSGGPAWIRSDQYDIEATMPDGPLPYMPRFVDIGGGRTAPQPVPLPRLKKMFQAMLADRFKLVIRRETREAPVYLLTVAKGGSKLTPWKDGDPETGRGLIDLLIQNRKFLTEDQLAFMGVSAAELSDRWARRTIEIPYANLVGAKATIANLIAQLEGSTLRTILDRTGITGEFNYRIPMERSFGPNGEPLANRGGGAANDVNALNTALEKELGLRLEPGKGQREVLVIESIERPSEN